jgi:type III pantothenate kinase
MLLAIDVGNTNIAFGIYVPGMAGAGQHTTPTQGTQSHWAHHWRIRTAPDNMPDEYAVLFRSLLQDSGLALDDVQRVVLSSVVPDLTTTLSEVFERQTGADLLIVGPDVRTGLHIRTDNPAEVGGDLVANAVAAHAQFKSNCIVVDFGTALTFTAVAQNGDLLGVAIAPGLRAAASALASNTAQLPRVRLVPPPAAIGRNTVHSIQSGVVFGYIGLVEALIRRMRAELGGKALAVATGGLARVIAPLSNEFAAIEPWLTLDGLRLISERNP